MFKRFLAAMMAMTLIVGMTVVSYAAYAPTPTSPFYYVENNTAIFGTLKTSDLTADEVKFLETWRDSKSGNTLLTYNNIYDGVSSNSLLRFYLFPSSSSIESSGSFEKSFRSSSNTYSLTFRITSGSAYYSVLIFDMTTGEVSRSYSFPRLDGKGSSWSISTGIGEMYIPGWSTYSFKKDLGDEVRFEPGVTSIGISDDLGIFGDSIPAPPDPEEPSSSTPPPTPSLPSTSFPTIPPSKSEWIPYDTTRWNGFLDSVKDAIGSSTNIGFLVFGILMGILIVPKIIKRFTS